MATSIVRFEPNVPQRLALKFSDGKETQGQYGPQKYYSTEDGRTFYLDMPVAAKIERLGIRKGQPFTIVKKSRRDAKGFDWEIVPEGEARTASSNSPSGETQRLESNLQQPQDSIAQQPTGLLMSSLCAAIDAATEAERYAARKGMVLKFNEEDVRCMAATVFIQVCKVAASEGANRV